ncbi:hypothetical protein CTT31_13065 [Pseudoalteromonas maricaloris]|uniref:hypothetical protein n=1 Tax=Pseudoalteromonas maricaloris TaxID=184924 RepID=UPI0021ADFD28|nr:hypothetical protein [Pseudoalteromonas flavipulchra]USE70003.1 hypothetical protein CTT31_13065 [Pseudoalteromonas flavipulchra]
MKQLLSIIFLTALAACTPSEITKIEQELTLAQQQRNLDAQLNALKSLNEYDNNKWQALYLETLNASTLLSDAQRAYDNGNIVTAQIGAGQSKDINNSLQADTLLRALSIDYPLTELIDELVQLHTTASKNEISFTSFFNHSPSKWNTIEINQKLLAINTKIKTITEQIETLQNTQRQSQSYQAVLVEAKRQRDLLAEQEAIFLRHLQQQFSVLHQAQFAKIYQTVAEQLNNFDERVVASMIRQDQNKLIETMQHQSELLYNTDLMLKQAGSERHAEFEPFYLAYIQLLNKPKDYREYVRKGEAALTLFEHAGAPHNFYQQYQTLVSEPLILSDDLLAFARSQNESKFLYRKY